jgi:hypothetical protein
MSNSITEVNFDDFEHSYIVNFLLNARDIYNVKAVMRREILESLTSIQAFIRELNQQDWIYQMQKNEKNQITHFFFVKICFKSMLQINFEILMMNVIYKTNKFKMFLFVINEQIVLHINFYVAFSKRYIEKRLSDRVLDDRRVSSLSVVSVLTAHVSTIR